MSHYHCYLLATKGLLGLLGMLMSFSCHANFVVTTSTPSYVWDDFTNYHRELVQLVLAKTQKHYGEFTIEHAPKQPTNRRARQTMIENKYKNFIRPFVHSTEGKHDKRLSFIKFPLYLGVMGYRVCFVNAKQKVKIAAADDLISLREFTHIQGLHWQEVDILRHNHFKVLEALPGSRPIAMLTEGRADLYCRGINEIATEYESNKHLSDLAVDESFVFHYPFPIYFYTHRDNKKLIKRVQEGILIAYNDGSLLALWERFFAKSVQYSKLNKRKIYRLENPYIADVETGYERYFYRM